MKNKDQWKPSKYVYRRGKLTASRNPAEVMVGSRLVADTVAALYDKYIPQFAKGRLIDLGCGKVPFFEAYRRQVTENVCVDWQHTEHVNEHLDYTCDLNERIPFNDGEFDTVILSDVLEHVAEPGRLWCEMARILKPSGKVLANVPFYYWLHEQPYDYYRYTEYALRRFAQLANFRILVLTPIGGAPEVLADILAKHMQTVPVLGESIAAATQSLVQSFVRNRLGRMWSQKTNRGFPLGYFFVAERCA
jgi:SAM-dependent methyltransferase